ncbi:hypothetical protein EKE94_14960 [Mesobaculum littorinae]|uniref:Toxin-antitoxin system YwqK family antitoxin n=1 Tax=Mesobaculum littorinae TaxID=2486419 RepID=A0A438AF43_9RHOB|nr:hypothetical protein [Mesobaculum littorinae]RVV97309.1 hypothetical protein EKE94_14960 [Mesobaculum littorinae]
MLRCAATAIALMLASPAFAASVNGDLQPDPAGDYTYDPPDTRTDGAYVIEVHDAQGRLYARLRNTAPRLGDGHPVGMIERFHPDGSLSARTPLNATGTPDGTLTRFWPSGDKRAERHVADGQPVGLSRRWSRDGALIRETEFTEDGSFVRERRWTDGTLTYLREPVAIEGHGTGEKITEYVGNFTETDTRADGYRLTTRHLHDKLLDRSEVIDGQLQGDYVHTEPIDRITSRVGYVDNEEHGLYTRVWKGEVLDRGRYDHGKRVGDWQRVESYGTTILETYDQQGRLNGARRRIGMNGERQSLETFVDGTLDGPFETRASDGSLMEKGRYDAGRKAGPWHEREPYGREVWRGSYEDGARTGRWDRLDGDGYLLEVVHYRDGDRHGLRYLLRPDGALREVQDWSGDMRDGYTTFYSEGRPVLRELWRDDVMEMADVPLSSE